MLEKTAVYTAFDVNGERLYIGISKDVTMRLTQHKQKSKWWKECTKISIRFFSSRGEARRVEALEVSRFWPKYNSQLAPRFNGDNDSRVYQAMAKTLSVFKIVLWCKISHAEVQESLSRLEKIGLLKRYYFKNGGDCLLRADDSFFT